MEHEAAGQELVKCVLVGDTAVGKTRLICARACNARMSLRQLLSTHVPTVWAIDQYRMYKEVLERSMANVDGVQVSLRLWDTFGDHEKDRRFAYGRSDVIVLCFSLGSRSSLLHCKTVWFPEIRRFCPDTPVILVGCKNDLRFLCRDSTYLSFCRDRSPFLRPTRECDLVMPEQARALANEFNVPYYETSVFTYHGVNQVFENAIRVALIARRNQRFWMTNLKHVQQPLLQAPYCPPSPMKELSPIEVYSGNFWGDIKSMLVSQYFPDLVFLTGGSELTAHRFVIAAGAPNMVQVLEPDDVLLVRRNSETSTASESTVDETECLLRKNASVEAVGFLNSMFSSSTELDCKSARKARCPIIEFVKTRDCVENLGTIQVVVQLTEKASIETVRTHLHFLYTGELPPTIQSPVDEVREAAELFNIPELLQYLESWARRDTKLTTELKKSYRQFFKAALWAKCVQGYHTDVVFHLDDGKVPAHRAILMARSDVMRAMFSGDFREKRSQSVALPGVRKEAFMCFLEYLYTDSLSPPVPLDIGMPLVELANRLCLPRLINILESMMINDIAQKQSHGVDVTDECIRILELAQLHNAEQLAQWCLITICENYDTVCRKHSKVFKELSPENRQWISQNRWPPVWYVKDFDYYQKALIERYKIDNPDKGRKRNNSGCLCFTGKSKRDEHEEQGSVTS
ncbi:unnamed protein product [Allacma fusca]|uniref:BTB domain-containing protein n=1 Tax=Allacma fusca TaxID=39272 RepID=A0A8J2JF24_9HEXA|nr:unnamed protein product [Allacma fusca]